MSFIHTTEQVRRRSKTVTRRLGWDNIHVGERLLAVDRIRCFRPGQTSNVLAMIEVVSVRLLALSFISTADLALEGFPGMSTSEFVEMFCREMKIRPGDPVRRIEFRYLDTPTVGAVRGG